MSEKELKVEFNKVYAALPLPIRKEIIAVIDREPMTWQICRLEVKQETELGDRILVYLKELKII
mgnify:CR=1 FL=1